MSLEFDYFYGAEAEQFTFFRIPKVLFKDKRFKDMSTDAKLLYGRMLDRMGLSMRYRWIDDDNRVYIAIKKTIIPGYGRKGMGWIKNPKKAAYNKIYNKTSFSIWDLFK